MLSKTKLLVIAFLCTVGLFAQEKLKAVKNFTQKDFDTYKTEENKYDLRTKKSFHLVKVENDTASYFLDPSNYKGILNYGVDFAARDKKVVNFIEDYNVYYTEVVFKSCSFSVSDSIAEIEGQIIGGWNSLDFKGKSPKDEVEISIGELHKKPSVIYLGNFNNSDYIITYRGEEKTENFPVDTLNTLVFKRLTFRENFPASTPFKVRFKVDKNSILCIGKLSCYVHFYAVGEMFFSKEKKTSKKSSKKDKNPSRFQRIIEKNIQVNDPKNQIKKETPLYYKLTEKAENLILTRQFAKAKETYFELNKQHPKLFARDIHNAIRCAILSRDIKTAFWWSEKLAEKGIELSYFNSKIFAVMKKSGEWKSFSMRYDSISKLKQSSWNLKLKSELNNLLNEDQADYGLENRKDPKVLYETTERITQKLIDLIKKEGHPSEERIGAFIKNDTILIQSPDFNVLIRHAIQQKPQNLIELNTLLEKCYLALEYDSKRSVNNRMFAHSCFHIYKGNLYNNKSCDYSNETMIRKMVFMFNNPNFFIIDVGDYIVSEYNEQNPEEWDEFYKNNFNLIMKLTDDWKFYEK